MKEPPREGPASGARFWLRAGEELIGWTNSRKVAVDWRNGFGPGVDVSIVDTKLHELVVRTS